MKTIYSDVQDENFERMGKAESLCSDTSFDFCLDDVVMKNTSAGSLSDFDLCHEFDVCSLSETIKSSKAESDCDDTKYSVNEEHRRRNLGAQIDELLEVEKHMRRVGVVDGTIKAATDILQLCFDARDWRTLNDMIFTLSKRRGQFKQAIKAVVQQAMQFIDQTPGPDKIRLLETLNRVSAEKLLGELERARFIKKVAMIMEERGFVAEAADLMQEVAVEKLSSMAKTEKIAFILEQVRLCLDCKAYSHARLHFRKIKPREFRAEGRLELNEAPADDIPSLSELKLIYDELMNRYKNVYPDKPVRVRNIEFTEREIFIRLMRRFYGGKLLDLRITDHLRHHLLPIQPRHQKRNKCRGPYVHY